MIEDEIIEQEERLDFWWSTVRETTKSLFTSTIAEYYPNLDSQCKSNGQSYHDVIWDNFGVLLKSYIYALVENEKGKNNPYLNLTEFVAEQIADSAFAYKKGSHIDELTDENHELREEFYDEYRVEYNKVFTKISIFGDNVIN